MRDCGKGFDDEELKELIKFLSLTGPMNKQDIAAQANGLEMVAVLLAFMGSQLHVASAAGRGSEFYFELEQPVVDPSPIGDVDFDADGR